MTDFVKTDEKERPLTAKEKELLKYLRKLSSGKQNEILAIIKDATSD